VQFRGVLLGSENKRQEEIFITGASAKEVFDK